MYSDTKIELHYEGSDLGGRKASYRKSRVTSLSLLRPDPADKHKHDLIVVSPLQPLCNGVL